LSIGEFTNSVVLRLEAPGSGVGVGGDILLEMGGGYGIRNSQRVDQEAGNDWTVKNKNKYKLYKEVLLEAMNFISTQTPTY
jgi:hypothetical protein